MSTFRTCRPLLVNAERCDQPQTITTDMGFRHVKRGEWIINGEDGECYVVDDAFFQRTFAPFRATPGNPLESRAAATAVKPLHEASSRYFSSRTAQLLSHLSQRSTGRTAASHFASDRAGSAGSGTL